MHQVRTSEERCVHTATPHIHTSRARRTRTHLHHLGHVCASETVPGRSAWAPAVAPVLSSKESRSLIQHLKPTLGKRKGEARPSHHRHTHLHVFLLQQSALAYTERRVSAVP